jgi:hypothetical protein
MSGLEGQRALLAVKFKAVLPHLDEAQSLRHGGVKAVARAAGVGEATVSIGVAGT